MDFSSLNTQGPRRAISSFETISTPLSMEFRSPTACFMIFCLHFLGCDVESIFRVLDSYDLGYTISEIVRFIEEEDLIQYKEILAPVPERRMTYTRSTGTILTVDFAQGRPEMLVVSATCISALSPRKIVNNVTPDGRQVVTVIVEGQLQFCSWVRGEFFPPTRLHTLHSIQE